MTCRNHDHHVAKIPSQLTAVNRRYDVLFHTVRGGWNDSFPRGRLIFVRVYRGDHTSTQVLRIDSLLPCHPNAGTPHGEVADGRSIWHPLALKHSAPHHLHQHRYWPSVAGQRRKGSVDDPVAQILVVPGFRPLGARIAETGNGNGTQDFLKGNSNEDYSQQWAISRKSFR